MNTFLHYKFSSSRHSFKIAERKRQRDKGRQDFHFLYIRLVCNIPNLMLRLDYQKLFEVFKKPPRQPLCEDPESLREENLLRWAQHFSSQSIFLFVTSAEQEAELLNRKLSRIQLLSKALAIAQDWGNKN